MQENFILRDSVICDYSDRLLVQRFHGTDHIQSVVIPGRGRGRITSAGGYDSGFAASRRPGMTPDMIQTSETLH
jgi:hypothetical protein